MSKRYYTTDEACALVAAAAREATFSRQAWWVWVGKLQLKPWKEHGRKVWWDDAAVDRVVAARKR